MRRGAFILALLVAACSAADERAPETPPSDAVAAVPAPAPAPTSSAAPVDCGADDYSGYDNAKACYSDQCNKGDAEACRMAESFNGNLFPDGDPETVRLEDMAYPDAREVILGMGWIPAGEDCGGGGTGETTCADFPEIDYCSGVGPGYCAMTFRRGDRCLDVLTTEGAPERGVTGRPYVKDVTFRKGPCRTAPNGG
ncbi:MAG: hypothetical protein H2049_12530 [Porphyrobacter sp.]|nr:hypothetical protein [Porphyrobacter sp.]